MVVLVRVVLHVRIAVAHHNPDSDPVVVKLVAVIVARHNARRIHNGGAGVGKTVGEAVDVVAQTPTRLLLLRRLLLAAVRRVGHRAGTLLVVLLLHLACNRRRKQQTDSQAQARSPPSPLVAVGASPSASRSAMARCPSRSPLVSVSRRTWKLGTLATQRANLARRPSPVRSSKLWAAPATAGPGFGSPQTRCPCPLSPAGWKLEVASPPRPTPPIPRRRRRRCRSFAFPASPTNTCASGLVFFIPPSSRTFVHFRADFHPSNLIFHSSIL